MRPPLDLPFTEWWQSTAAHTWLEIELLPVVGPPLAAAVLLPILALMAGCSRMCCRTRGKVGRKSGLACVIFCAILAALLLALVLWAALLLLATAISYEGTALNATLHAQDFTCMPSEPAPPGASAVCAAALPPTACAADSLLGFTNDLTRGTIAATGMASSFISQLSGTVDGLVPLIASSEEAAVLGGALAANVSALNTTITDLRLTLAAAHTIGAPYFPNSPNLWAPLAATALFDVPALPAASVVQVNALAAQLAVQHDQMGQLVENAQATVKASTAPALAQLQTVNSTVLAEASALTAQFEGAANQMRTLCTTVDDTWRSTGLPSGDVTDQPPVSAVPTIAPTVAMQLESPALEIAITLACIGLLPAVLLLVAGCGTAKGCSCTLGGGGGLVVVLALPLLLVLSALCLALVPLLSELCAPGAIDELIHTNLRHLPNVSLPTPPSSGGAAPAPPDASRSIAELVTSVLHCPPNGNLIDQLHLEAVVSFGEPLAALTASLTAELAAFNSTAAAPIDAAIAALPEAAAVLESTSTFAPSGLDSSLSHLSNMTSTMRLILPSAHEPPAGLERIAWDYRFQQLYGTPPTGPDAQMIIVNARLHERLDAADNLTAPLTQLVASCNTSANAAPAVLQRITDTLKAARADVSATWSQGRVLQTTINDVVDDVERARDVTPCGWVGSSYQRARSLTCDAVHTQAAAIGLLLAAAAALLFVGVCTLTCTRNGRPLLALEPSRRLSQPALGGAPLETSGSGRSDLSASMGGYGGYSVGGYGGYSAGGSEEALVAARHLGAGSPFASVAREPSGFVERESPFHRYTAQRRLSRGDVGAEVGLGRADSRRLSDVSGGRLSVGPSERRESHEVPSPPAGVRRYLDSVFGSSSNAASNDNNSAPLPALYPDASLYGDRPLAPRDGKSDLPLAETTCVDDCAGGSYRGATEPLLAPGGARSAQQGATLGGQQSAAGGQRRSSAAAKKLGFAGE